jgi:glycosyltransferase involved in cell wall biosynthesis
LQSHQPDRKTNLPIKVSHLGADIKASAPSTGRPDHGVQLLTKLSTIPSFIMVGTIEPRKGHLQALAAFELLWKQGLQVNLVIVGKEGWVGLPDKERRTIPKILAKLKNHKEIGQRLFWLEGISDEYLEQMYATCACLIAASEAEGFGLPLIEAAQHQLPIIVRDIPVFKEVVGEHAYYFEGLEAEALSKAIKDWLVLYKQGIAPDSTNIPWLTWEQSAQQLIEQIIPKAINHWK